jgi:hypothetical protein
MKICAGFGVTIFSTIFTSLEFIAIIVLFILYLRQIINLWNYPNASYDKIDLILIYLSEIQLITFFIRLILNYNIFSVLILINKFSQNLMICSLLMIIILDKYSNSKTKIINYFLMTLLITDILLFLIGINDDKSFKKAETESMFHMVMAIICSIINLIIIYYSYNFKMEGINKINDNLNKNKLVSLQNVNNINNDIDNENDNDYEEQSNEKDFFNTVLNQYLSNAITILSVYLYILIPFLISYIIEIIIYFYFNSNIINTNDNEIRDNNNNNTTNNDTAVNNNTDYNNSQNININSDYSCIFIQKNENYFGFGKFCICFILFILRDCLPYSMTYLMFFYYKLKHHRRSF